MGDHGPVGFGGRGLTHSAGVAKVDLATLDPFLHMNQMGEGENASGELRVALAPYRGSETVTHMIHGILPARLNWNPPRYQNIRGGAVALLSSLDDGALLRVITGEVAGHQALASPARR